MSGLSDASPDAPSRRRRAASARLALPTEYSAGGVMVDADGRCAVAIRRISRRGRAQWLLPKGHIEPGETPRAAAEREVLEETGIRGSAGPALGQIRYKFYANHVLTRKIVRHFLLRMEGGELSTEDHEVSDVAWFPLEQLAKKLAHTDERVIIGRAMELLRVADP